MTSSNDNALKIDDLGDTAFWFRQHTKEFNMDGEDINIEHISKNDSMLGKIFSRAFSGFQPYCNPALTSFKDQYASR